jgi:hypothetical protein
MWSPGRRRAKFGHCHAVALPALRGGDAVAIGADFGGQAGIAPRRGENLTFGVPAGLHALVAVRLQEGDHSGALAVAQPALESDLKDHLTS